MTKEVKAQYSAFKKCNDIGKKLNFSGTYIMQNGMLLGYAEPEDEMDNDAIGIQVSFIEDKMLEKLGALAYLSMKIDGVELYRMEKEYTFNRFEVDDRYVYFIFEGLHTEEDGFTKYFTNEALAKGFSSSEIMMCLANMERFISINLSLYMFYIECKKRYDPKPVFKEFIYKAERVDNDDPIVNKIENVMNILERSQVVGEKEFNNEIFSDIFSAERPVNIEFELDNGKYEARVMKSLFSTATAKSDIVIRLIKSNDEEYIYYLILVVKVKDFTTCSVYKTVQF